MVEESMNGHGTILTTPTMTLEALGGATFKANGLALPDDLTRDQWANLREVLAVVEGAPLWWWGDWLAFGQEKWKTDYSLALDKSGYKKKTLYEACHVARSVPISIRMEVLTWTHHQLVQALPEDRQVYWLQRAAREGWTRAEMRFAMRQGDEEAPDAHKIHYSSADDEWYTPPEVIAAVVDFFGTIDLDPCCEDADDPTVPATVRYTEDDDGLTRDWRGRVYMNYLPDSCIMEACKCRCHRHSWNVADAGSQSPSAPSTSRPTAVIDVAFRPIAKHVTANSADYGWQSVAPIRLNVPASLLRSIATGSPNAGRNASGSPQPPTTTDGDSETLPSPGGGHPTIGHAASPHGPIAALTVAQTVNSPRIISSRSATPLVPEPSSETSSRPASRAIAASSTDRPSSGALTEDEFRLSWDTSPHCPACNNCIAVRFPTTVYVNPPYGDAIGQWATKLHAHYQAGDIEAGIALVPARTDTQWFRTFRNYAVCFVNGRLHFSGDDDSAPFPSALIYLGDEIDRYTATVAHLGDVWTRRQVEAS